MLFLASASPASQCHSLLIPASLWWLSLTIWVTLPTPPSSSVQKPSIQFYTRPHLSVNLSVPFFSWAIPPGPTHPTAQPGLNAAHASDPAFNGSPYPHPLLLEQEPLSQVLSSSFLHCSFDMFLSKGPLKAKFWYLTSLIRSLYYPVTFGMRNLAVCEIQMFGNFL